MQFTLISALAFATLAIATVAPVHRNDDPPCDTGDFLCCNIVFAASSAGVDTLLDPLGIDVNTLTGLIGVTCRPVSASGGNFCPAQPVCCSNNTLGGDVAFGCTPVGIDL